MPRSIPIAHAMYAVADTRWTATLRRFTDGPKRGRYFVDYWLPAPGGKRKRKRPEFAWCEHDARVSFETFVADCIPPDVADALASIAYAPVSDAPTIAEILAWYVRDVMPARGYTQRTRDQNTVIFRRFTNWCKAQDLVTVEDLANRQQAADSFINYLASQNLKPSTIRRDVSKLRAAFRAAVQREMIDREPVREWPRPAVPEQRMDMLTPEEFHKLLDRFRDTGSSFYAVFRFIAFTGCRPSDACGLRWQDVDLDARAAVIRIQKTRKLVAIPLVGEILDAVKSEQGLNAEWVFTNRRGRRLNPGLLCTMLRYQSKIAIGRPVGPKLFRRNVVSLLINAGADRDHVRALTGHRSDAIAAYLRVSQSAAHGLAERLQAALKNDTE